MEFWIIFLIISVIAIVIEVFVPTMFCINFAFAGIITAIISVFWGNLMTLSVIFLVLSALSIIFLKPLLMKLVTKEKEVDFDAQYKDKIVKVVEPVTKTSGAVTIYEERWEARLSGDSEEEIPAGCDVKIVANDSLTLYVEKV